MGTWGGGKGGGKGGGALKGEGVGRRGGSSGRGLALAQAANGLLTEQGKPRLPAGGKKKIPAGTLGMGGTTPLNVVLHSPAAWAELQWAGCQFPPRRGSGQDYWGKLEW